MTLSGSIVKASRLGGPGVMSKVALVSGVRGPALATSVYPVAALCRFKSAKVATPFTAATVFVPESVSAPGFVPIVIVTESAAVDTRLSYASRTATVTDGTNVQAAMRLPGCATNTSCAAAPGLILNAELVAAVNDPALARSVYPVPTLLRDTLANVATPFTAFTVVVPESVPAPGLAPNASVTAFVAVVARFPKASCSSMATAGE